MKSLARIGFALIFIAQISSFGLAQSGIITTYVGPQLPIDGSMAISQAIDHPTSVVSDCAGGFYVVSNSQNKVYRVAADGTLSLIAGSGTPGFSGDGGPATLAQINWPMSIAVDTAGNLFIADTINNRIRRVTPGGVINTVAGNGTQGFSGDGGAATLAQLNHPWGVALDMTGNLFIADTDNNRIRKVAPGGVISTVAGNGTQGFSGDGGPAALAQLGHPWGVAVDMTGNLFLADSDNYRVRKVTTDGMIHTVAGDGNFGYGGDGGPATSAQVSPAGVAVDAAGNLFIADVISRIRKVAPDGMISTVAGNEVQGFDGDGGPAISAQLFGPIGVAVDSEGNLFIADTGNNRIRNVTPEGIISTKAGNGTWGFSGDGGTAASAQLYYPTGVAVDISGNLLIADTQNFRIRKVAPNGVINTVAGNGTWGLSGDGGPATSAQFSIVNGVAVDTEGNIFVADTFNNSIRKVASNGVINTVAGNGTWGFSGDGGTATSAQLNHPTGIAVDMLGNLLIADQWNHRIRKVTPDGIIQTIAGDGTGGFAGDGSIATSAQLNQPRGIAMDMAGNLFIADSLNHRIRKVATNGVISTVAGNGDIGYSGDGGPATSAQVPGPLGVTVDTVGNLFITTLGRVRKVTPDGTISTVAGRMEWGFSGDGGPATSAQFHGPDGIAVDVAGNLFIADVQNHRIRKVAAGSASIDLTVSSGGSATSSTVGLNQAVQTGYAGIEVNSGTTPYGTAVFSFKQNGVTVSEAGVPTSPPTTAARVFIDYGSSVVAIPAHADAGAIGVNTGIAVANCGSTTANITYTLRRVSGDIILVGQGTLAAGAHFAKFIHQLVDEAPDFVLPEDFQTTTQFASLEISSDQPVSVIALRLACNQRQEMIFTTIPVADLTQPAINDTVYFPQFADGGGYSTSIILLNTSDQVETGTLQVMDNEGNPLVANWVGGTADYMVRYTIPAGGLARFQTDGFPVDSKVGWAMLMPDAGTSTPIGAGIFSYNPGNCLQFESGVPATLSTTHARIYVDLSGGHNTGLAIANPTSSNSEITMKAFESDGITKIGTIDEPLQLPANGHKGRFANEFVSGLPAGFTGVLDISSLTPFAALTMRSLDNERGEFVAALFPVADMTRNAPAPIVFPQIADGGGYVTQFVLIGAGETSSTTLNFYDNDGNLLAVGK